MLVEEWRAHDRSRARCPAASPLTMGNDVLSWDETEETGLRLCAEHFMPGVSPPTDVTACCWDTNSPGMVGLCDSEGSFVLAKHEPDAATPITSYAVYFNTLPVHLWGGQRAGSGGGGGERTSPPPPSAPARRVPHAWSQVSFVPGHPGDVVFVQGRSCRVLWARLPEAGGRKAAAALTSRSGSAEAAGGGRFGLVDGSRVVALDGHRAQVGCLSIDRRGELLVTGDESGAICARLLHLPGNRSGDGTAYRSSSVEGGSSGGGGVAEVLREAHSGEVLAISHVESGAGDDDPVLFVSGGKGGVVRLWKAACLERSRETAAAGGGGGDLEVQVELLKDMLVGGFQVSCLAASLSPTVPIVLAGTVEGTVFAFHLLRAQEPSDRRDGEAEDDRPAVGYGDRGGRGGNAASGRERPDDAVGRTELGAVLMKFEHTSEPIEGVCCSQEQELIAATDAAGIVRTYRPLLPRGGSTDNNPGDGVPPTAAAAAEARRFELVVECRLGARPVSCEFGSGPRGVESGGERRGVGGEGEVLRTCTARGVLRLWPTASLPTRPVRPPPPSAPTRLPDDLEALAPLPHPSNAGTDSSSGGGGGGNKNPEMPHAAAAAAVAAEQENRDPSDPFSRWTAIDAKGRVSGVVGVSGGERGEEEELTARGEPPLPKARPAAPRRVSFAPADQVYKLEDPYYGSSNNSHQQQGDWEDDGDDDGKEEDHDELEAPRPPPPAPTPMRASGANGPPRRLRQTWGTSTSSPRGGRARRGYSMDASDDAFVAPSRMQEPSLWSTAAEQAELERRMTEEFDGSAVPQPAATVYRAAAAAAVNIHPLAKTFEGLVPVSLDAPPPRPMRKGKQVSKSHLSKVQEQRITEEDLAFDGMEPDCSAIMGFGNSTTCRMWPHEELEWYGGRKMFAELDRSSTASDRVWSLGRRL